MACISYLYLYIHLLYMFISDKTLSIQNSTALFEETVMAKDFFYLVLHFYNHYDFNYIDINCMVLCINFMVFYVSSVVF